MDWERVKRSLANVAAFRASGLKAKVWCEANGVPLKDLSSWCSHASRWQARLDGVPGSTSASTSMPKAAGGFVAARLPAPTTATVRIELHAGSTRLELHWPVGHTRELAAWLREVGQ